MSHQTPVIDAEGFNLEEWNTFKKTHKKVYDSEEDEKMRIKLFLETKKKVAEHNANFEKGLVTFTMAINQFADRTPEEIKRTH